MRKLSYEADNVFARIIRGEIEAEKIYEDANVIAVKDLYPVAPIHLLIIPKDPYIDYGHFVSNAPAELIVNYFRAIDQVTHMFDLNREGYRLITNAGSLAGQSVFHFHTHIIGKAEFNRLI
jgi:histidine triad (HIT) family protein